MELTMVSEMIYDKIEHLDSLRSKLSELSENKSKHKAEYEKAIAITIVKLRNGVEMNFEGQKISNPPTTITEKIARGICWEQHLQMDKADTLYKSLIVEIDTVKSELNGLQSINRHLDEH